MANSNRTALLTKMHRVLKQQYTPADAPTERPLLEHLLFALVLENAPYEAAEKIYNHLAKNFFDWNEVRVSTVTELAEVARALPDPIAVASNVKRVLQGVFESTYSFDLEPVKKQNISAAHKQLERLGGATPFSLGYVTQFALGGHAIPLDRGALDVLAVVGVISESEAQSGKVSGLERVIPKNKGVEFSSLLHQLAADYVANPFSPNVRKLLLSISADAKDRFPKRSVKKEEPKEEPRAAGRHAGEHGAKSPSADGKGKHAPEKHGTDKHTTDKHAGEKHGAEKHAADKHGAKDHGKTSDKEPTKGSAKSAGKVAVEKRTAEKPTHVGDHKAERVEKSDKSHRTAEKGVPEKTDRGDAKKSAAGKHSEGKHVTHKHSEGKAGDSKHPTAGKQQHAAAKPKSATKQLSKRKPR